MEHQVTQRTAEWFELRNQVILTASHFGDALGLGKGKPYDYLVSLLSDDEVYLKDEKDKHLQHGFSMEKIIEEAYQLLTGSRTRSTGFWTVKEKSSDKLYQEYFGASPDAIVLGKNYNPSCNVFDGESQVGLVEFKAPVYQMYHDVNTLQGIPRYYIAQMQGQMAITGAPWCDFMAVCCETKDISLKRVFYCDEYWQKIGVVLKQFCMILKEAKQKKATAVPTPLDFQAAKNLKFVPQRKSFFTGEDRIKIVDLLKKGKSQNSFIGPSAVEYNYSILIGEEYNLPESLADYGKSLLKEIDLSIRSKVSD
ncbi:uncharacterized protein LOC126817750 [Patella vulgata]|uniref:uncharacterized protein LOC126817750 n=1 Tax=Patella vulgata TaxID=6465 RepID=UPI00217F68FA|nr:uncharacterized protein LOC126817750 [Patella vulgata]XP_050400852.1 uncharacterized protein LOC126817750 [Patella vulgata]XP_050400854.1 uncharacterized protein LOC126817750 [Patella vulgata]XP_050400855.1 uncharacterized protein LOC126817750 [Patella vulgata]